MKVTTERLPKSIVALNIELDQQQVQKGLERAARKLSQQYRIPGFRPGKAPRQIIENYFGRERLLEEAAEDLIQKTFPEALKQENLMPVGRPNLENIEQDPFRYRVSVPVEPTVELPDYTAYNLPYEPEQITDEQVQQLLDAQREQHVVLQELDEQRPAQEGDMLSVRIVAEDEDEDDEDMDEDEAEDIDEDEAEVEAPEAELEAGADEAAAYDEDDEDEQDEDEEAQTQQIALVEDRVQSDVYQALLGAQVGETRTVTVQYDEDEQDESLRGRTVTYQIMIDNIQERQLPEWDELPTLANFDGDLDAMRANARQRLEQAAQTRARQEIINQFLERLQSETPVEVPDAMIEERAEELWTNQFNQFRQLGLTEEQFLQAVGKTREEAIGEFSEQAEDDVRRSLIVRELLQREGVQVTDEDIATETEEFLDDFEPERRDDVRRLLSQRNMQQTIRSSALNRKASDRIFALATGQSEPPTSEGVEPVTQADETPEPQPGDAAENGPEVLSDIATGGVSDHESVFQDPGPQETPGASSVDQASSGDYGQAGIAKERSEAENRSNES